ncbi:hypothetical protein DFH08DRAFT_966977 [Mycena albidolilacea]|uniref:Uncharacterized protein n=1 Tax=Mycena albidolilacea TaxID=1033008 RepID=A0AAD6ZMV6_9AGAR|nr:hypothetical protein DFH08DRAFT_966977 [Mycena albidolilacea]
MAPLHSLPHRAQMEAERLACRKRVPQDDEQSAGDSKPGATVSSTAKTPLASRIFYDGAFFPTMTRHTNPRADGREAIQFTHIVGTANSSDLKLAVVSSFDLDHKWLAPHFNTETSDLPLKSISDLSELWDWSSVTAELVPSIAGKHEGWNKIKMTGHPRLMRSLEKLGLTTSETQNLVLECQGSSIGTYTTQWFNQFYTSASGHPTALKAHMELSEGKRKKLEYPRGVNVVFPTTATVVSAGGHVSTDHTVIWSSAFIASAIGLGLAFCKRTKWDAKNFPRAAFYDSKSGAGKMIIGSFTQKKKRDIRILWPGRLDVNNYELGVVVPLMTPEEVNIASAWERPPSKYTADDGPWENR